MSSSSMLDQLNQAEKLLLRRYGLRLRVDRISLNGRYALCTVKHVERRLFRADLKAEETVAACHEALSALHMIGVDPLIDIVPPTTPKEYPKLDPHDPFGLCLAFRGSGHDALLPGVLLAPPVMNAVVHGE